MFSPLSPRPRPSPLAVRVCTLSGVALLDAEAVTVEILWPEEPGRDGLDPGRS